MIYTQILLGILYNKVSTDCPDFLSLGDSHVAGWSLYSAIVNVVYSPFSENTTLNTAIGLAHAMILWACPQANSQDVN